jgi:hypothetical protein
MHTLTNASGCDSVVTLDLTISASVTGTDLQSACGSYTWIDSQTYTSSNNAATFTLQSTQGCDSIVTLNLTIGNDNTGTDVQTACDSYTWIDSQTYTSSNNTATHTLTNNAGCDSVVTLDLTITTVDATVSTNLYTITATASGATYQWIDCNDNNAPIAGETGQSYTATANGDYAVIVMENGCTETSACENITGIGVGEVALNDAITIYPNPSQGMFVITVTGVSDNVSILVTDMLGKTVYDAPVSNGKAMLNLSEQAPGIYLVQVQTQGAVVTRKIIKE